MADGAYDAIVLGGGPGGTAVATQVARRGGWACLVERGHLGGACLNVGCIPTKAMLAAGGVCRRMRNGAALGLEPVEPKRDGRAFMRRVRDVVETLRTRAEGAAKANRAIDVVRGSGRLIDAHTVAVQTPEGAQRVTGRAVVIATGSAPVRPGFAPWDSPRVMTTDEATVAEDLPESVLVVGGGVIGCEFATIYGELGVPTTLVEMLDGLLPPLDADAGKAVAQSLAEVGVTVHTGRKIAEMSADDGGVTARLDDGTALRADRALIAVGRKANVDGVGLETVGLSPEGGILPVDDRCRTGVEGIYAVGDVAEERQYAHLAERMGYVAAECIMGYDCPDDRAVVPVGVYTHPEVASVGLSLAEAKRRFNRPRVFRYSLANSSMAVACGEPAGGLKVVADAETGQVHGALWIGPHATDLIQEFALVMRCGLTLGQLHETIHAHPTFQEAAAAVAEAWAAHAARKGRSGKRCQEPFSQHPRDRMPNDEKGS